ncbi:hypothetical protein FRC07_004309 [Ceratobasidium sp. 392]|nr:hypothetical protein FRC07_004309 [Ceratobasidium sp. 392]
MAGVSAVQVPKVICMCALAFGVKIGHIPSPRSVGQFILEGGVGSRIQVGDILAKAQGITTSMDSTLQQNINFSSMHIMANTGDAHQQLYLAVESTPDHTSETQVAALKSSLETVCNTTRRAPKCSTSPDMPIVVSDIARKLCGANGNHAKDQLKVAELEWQWKVDSWVEYLGNLALLNLESSEAKTLYGRIQTSSELAAGGTDAFMSMSAADQEALHTAEYSK